MEVKDQIKELFFNSLIRIKETDSSVYKLPEKYRKYRAAALFQTIGQLVKRGKTLYIGGSLTDGEYLLTYHGGVLFKKSLGEIYPSLKSSDLHIIFEYNKDPHALLYRLESDSYILVKLKPKTTSCKTIFELSIGDIADTTIISTMLTKALFPSIRTLYI